MNQSVYVLAPPTYKYNNKGIHEITHEVLTGQVIEDRQMLSTLYTISTWPT